MAPISAKTTNSLKDLQEGYQLLLKSRPILWYPYLPVVFIFVYLLTSLSNGGNDNKISTLLVVFVSLPAWRWICEFLKRRHIQKHPDFGQSTVWEFSEAMISRTHAGITETLSWRQPHRISAYPKGLLLDIGCNRFHYLPIRAFATTREFRKLCSYARTHASGFKNLT
ncbi:MAG: hypothetical protein QM627_05020 [Luteolibacter sp.]